MRLAALPSHFHSALAVCHPKTRAYVRLLGPCFKTGRLRPFRQHPERGCAPPRHTPGGPARHCLQSRTGRRGTPDFASLVARAAIPSLRQELKGPVCNAARGRLPSRAPARSRPTDVDLPKTPASASGPRPGSAAGSLALFPAAAQTSAGLSAGEALLPSIGSLLTISRAFNSFFKVLFIFPSQYLFAIGLVPVFSFR